MKEGCVMGRTIGIVTVALVLAFFGEMASVLNITTQCLLMQRSFWKYYYYYIQTAAGGHGCSRTLLLLQQPKQQHTLEKFLPFGQDVYSRFCIEKNHTHMLLDITFLFKFSSKKHSSNNPAEEKSNSSCNFIIDDKLVTAKILVDVSMIFL